MSDAKRQVREWFAVKTLYRWIVDVPRARSTLAGNPSYDLFEERVVLFRARDATVAIRFAEREAKRYASQSYENLSGERIRMKYLNACNCFTLAYAPAEGCEVFSSTELIRSEVTNRTVILAKMGKMKGAADRKARRRFSDAAVHRASV